MTLPATLFGTTVRVLRTAAGRRVLQLVLLVGGLFLLGFLCGEQAHAAEGTPVTPAAPVARAEHAAPVAELLSEAGHPGNSDAIEAVQGSGGNTLRAVTSHVVSPVLAVTERAVTPVRTVVDMTNRSLGEVQAEVPDPAGAPDVGAPGLPEVTEPPVRELPVPVGLEPLPGKPGGGTAHPPVPAGGHHQGAHAKARAGAGVGSGAVVVLPYAAPGPFALPVSSLPAHPVAHRVGTPADAPGRPVPAPTGDPDGVLGKQVADGNSLRHGDAQAVAPAGRAPLRLVPGAAAPVDAPHTRERHRDIPVFPG
ncbi:hypothetical protein ACGFYV_29300 [Streptomyces sp. NPDC048297]|uniref:hypothetical protein n=1 Tax=Streptomyces sp. NPDC048297 TaxID=3365531 RepID=UPI00371825B9